MAAHGSIQRTGEFTPTSTFFDQGKFGRMFANLPPFLQDNPTARAALETLGAQNGLMDAKDELAIHPRDLITDANKFINNPDNPTMTAGMTFLGQFLDHDITLDITSQFEQQVDPEMIQNFRTPAFELDSLYGQGPGGSPHLYDQTIDRGQTSFLVEAIPDSQTVSRDGSIKYDLPRNSQNKALVGDPRNDENLVLSQLHLAFLRFHNAVVAKVKSSTGLTRPGDIFAEAQRLVRWHYQWIILHEFLPKTVGQDLVNNILDKGNQFYKVGKKPFIPVEFAVAAYRFGHSQVRPSYRMNFGPSDDQQAFALLFNEGLAESPVKIDMRGGQREKNRFIDWQTFFDFGDNRSRNNKRIDAKLSTVLMAMPDMSSGPMSLASRNLLRHLTFKLPSGQAVAKAMGVKPLAAQYLEELKPLNLEERTPLWYYILKEAEVLAEGKCLGPIGGRIVAEVFIGILQASPLSYLSQDKAWTPDLGPVADQFSIVDLLHMAGVVTEM